MFKALVDRIAELGRQAADPRVIDSGDPRKARVAYGGEVVTWDCEPPLRNHTVYDLDSLIAWAVPREDDPQIRVPTVWHSPGGVVVLLDDEDRRDRVTFPLTLTRAALAIRALRAEERKAWQQRELIRFLRIELGLPPAIIAPWRRLDWDSSQKTASIAEHGRDRMGRDVSAAVVGAVDLPEVIAVPLVLYEQSGEQEVYQVLLAVEIAAIEQRIYLAPQPLALENAILAHQQTIQARLVGSLGEAARVYFGSP